MACYDVPGWRCSETFFFFIPIHSFLLVFIKAHERHFEWLKEIRERGTRKFTGMATKILIYIRFVMLQRLYVHSNSNLKRCYSGAATTGEQSPVFFFLSCFFLFFKLGTLVESYGQASTIQRFYHAGKRQCKNYMGGGNGC